MSRSWGSLWLVVVTFVEEKGVIVSKLRKVNNETQIRACRVDFFFDFFACLSPQKTRRARLAAFEQRGEPRV
jgi:hypothetical protein